MKMRFNMSRGLVARLSLCLGLVLLLALIASVAPAGAVVPSVRPCADSCDPCVKDDTSETCTEKEKCVAVCRIRGQDGKMKTVYFHFTKECCTWTSHKWCQPQTRCTDNNQCEKTGNPGWKTCKGQVKECSGWIWDGEMYYDRSCSTPINGGS